MSVSIYARCRQKKGKVEPRFSPLSHNLVHVRLKQQQQQQHFFQSFHANASWKLPFEAANLTLLFS